MKFKQTEIDKLELTDTIKCSNCGNSVSLSTEETTNCDFCNSEVKIPENYRKLKQKQLERQKQLDEAEEVYKEISIPPKKWMLTWNNLAEGVFSMISLVVTIFVWLGGAMALALIFFLYFGIMAIAPIIHVNYLDTIGAGWIYLITFALFTLLIILPMVLNAFVKDFLVLKTTLQANLMAKFSDDNKKIPICRNCGAPLDTLKPHFCIPCDYCETENIINVKTDWFTKIKEFTVWQFKTLDKALKQFHLYKKEMKENLNLWIYGSVFFLFISYGIGVFVTWIDLEDKNPPNWKVLTSQPQKLYSNKDHSTLLLNQKNEWKNEDYWIALNYNQNLVVQIESEFKPQVVISNTTTSDGNKIADFLKETLPNQWEWKAPYKGKFLLTIKGNTPFFITVSVK